VPPVDTGALSRLARAAGDGDSAALEEIIGAVRDDVYRLALRMLWHPDDAEDATQEALIRIVTRIGSYRGEAAFRTWAYRVAANHILNWRHSRVEQENLNFRRYGEQLVEGLTDPDTTRPDAGLLVEEVKLGCTLGMLLCLDRDHRLAYLLSDVFDIPSSDAAYICETTAAAFRKRASRARAQLRHFVGDHCGLVTEAAPCRCDRRVKAAIQNGRVQPDDLHFAGGVDPGAAISEMEQLQDLASLMRNHPQYQTPKAVTTAIRTVIKSGKYKLLE
jgi:RNA polymerase sigma factor (sigma-70 family)